MMRMWLRVAVVFVLLSATAFGFEYYNFDFVGGGARARGMGNAYLGISDGVNGASWNPAGIYLDDKIQLGVSYQSLIPRGNSVVSFAMISSASDHTGSFGSINSLSFIAPLRIKGHPFVGSVNWTRNADIFQQSGFNFTGTEIFHWITTTGPEDDTLALTQDVSSTLDGGLYTANFAFGTRFYDKVSFGLSVNVYSGHIPRTTTSFTAIPDFRYDPNGAQRGLATFDVTTIDTNKFSGVNFTIGFKYTGDKFDGGVIVRTPFTLNNKFDESIFNIYRFNNLVQDDGTDTVYFGNNLIKYEMPLIIGGGIGYKATENLLLAADLEFRKFSGLKVKNRTSITINPGGTNEEKFQVLDPMWKNTFVVRTGAEYMKQTSIGEVPLRAGFGYVPSQAPNVDVNGNTSTATQYNVTAGTGIHWNQIKLDIAYTYSTFDRTLSSTVPATNQGAAPTVLIENEKDRNHQISFSFSGVF
jgi:hypothetical protein